MTLRCVLAVLALAGATFAGQEVTELKVDVVSVPEECTVKSKHGDMLTMHYTGTLDNGNKFDSRYVPISINFSESSFCKAIRTYYGRQAISPEGVFRLVHYVYKDVGSRGRILVSKS